MGDFNVVLLVICIIVCIVTFIFNTYILINYQHPDDSNQAYFPKFVVVLGLSVAEISILMLPADVANRRACQHAIYNGSCNLTLPMKQLWYAIYCINAILVFVIIPFSIFYYEGDQEKTWTQRVFSAVLWCGATVIVVGLILGILYGLVGKVDFTVRRLNSNTVAFTTDFSQLTATNPCFPSTIRTNEPANQCAAYLASSDSIATWTMQTSFPVYVIALSTILGSFFFSFFGGIGIAILPLSLIFAFIRRPKTIITRAQYIREATDLGKRAKEIREVALALQREERSGSKGRKWKKNVKQVQQELVYLEQDQEALEEVYPQGEKAETSWALTVLGYLGKLFFGLIGLVVTVVWIVHIIIYMLINPPVSPFLNSFFVKLDNAWGLLGTTAFAFFCVYLILAVISGEMHVGLNFFVITIHPMKWGGTLMNSFLFNVGLILLCSISVIQFCAKAFAIYAQATAVQEIFGNNLEALRGIKYLFRYNIFQIAFVIFALLTTVYYLTFGFRKKQRKGKFQLV
ncbi:LMBR1 domain-containing protein 1 [Marchantia polymorpha subsp. ruderalis]|uniref:LIMR family protein n=2 Tax=Marchantia polymorpha TaxID=3197 RepID=A0A176WAR0_MARPO|nr:hypothetical protein AXG93_509s1440 [Marchantia polymorpha subsp. ruderalis]PTQ37265.1 hypothetical protein MARPO_0058s0053 [Marchantia polymorpha]BBN12511.1 hypothetical protein Mp_5g20730 [Marchantia polymorpha subsp. ruderalis]|eukprot:PTQ37265.1 hypothetical protein MARPO_0058s0053 [Marchantia polymorpha]